MTDVSAWDPVDDNNSAAPPAGWPEGMMPSGVNNSARAMMGALRREHDRIVGQIGSTPGKVTAASGYTTRAGIAGAPQGNVFNLDWTVSNGVHMWIDSTDEGAIASQAWVASNYLPSSGGALAIASGGTAGTTQAQAFANIATVAASIGTNPGYMKFPNGLLMQWGGTAGLAGANSIGVTFPTAFSGFATVQATVAGDQTAAGGVGSISLSGFTATSSKATGGSIYWFAIGF